MAGIILESGQVFAASAIKDKIDSLGGLYVGLMTNAVNPQETSQVGDGITELDPLVCSGYIRTLADTWSIDTIDKSLIKASGIYFTPTNTWSNVRGYFVATESGCAIANALWCESFPTEKQRRDLTERIYIIPKLRQDNCEG